MLLLHGCTLSLFAIHWCIISLCYKFLSILLFTNKVHHCFCMFHVSFQSQGISRHIIVLFHNFLAQARVVWVLSQCNITLPLLKSGVVGSVNWHSVLIIHGSLFVVKWKENVSETYRCFEAKCNKNAETISTFFFPNLSCCDRDCNRVKVLPTIALRIHPDLQ